jgi:hypothetical protein
MEAIFADGGAVTAAAIAACAEEDRHYVEVEADGAWGADYGCGLGGFIGG